MSTSQEDPAEDAAAKAAAVKTAKLKTQADKHQATTLGNAQLTVRWSAAQMAEQEAKAVARLSQAHPHMSSYIAKNITIGERFRTVTEDAIQAMMASIDKLGLLTPITVRETEDDLILVAGCCRLQAVLRLGWLEIDAFVMPDDATEDDIHLLELAENLHRQDLTVQERAEHIAEWIRLTKAKAQIAPSEKKHTGGRPDQGINAAVRDLGIDRTEAQRSMKIAGIEPGAKETARQYGLSQSALLAVAKAPKDQQVAKVHELARLGSRQRATPGPKLATVDGKPTTDTAVKPGGPPRLLVGVIENGKYTYAHMTPDELALDGIMQLVCPAPSDMEPDEIGTVTKEAEDLIRFVKNDPAVFADYARRFVHNVVAKCQARHKKRAKYRNADGSDPKAGALVVKLEAAPEAEKK